MFNRDTGFASLKMIFLRGQLPSQETRTTVYFNFRIIPTSPKENVLHMRGWLLQSIWELTYGVLVGEGRRAGRRQRVSRSIEPL